MSTMYDVIVAGLGPAGTVAVWHLAKKGFKVLGVDMRDWSTLWGKPCGDALGAHHVEEAGLPPLPSHVIKNNVAAIDIYSPGETTRYRVHGEGYIISRRALGEWLLKDSLNHGAELWFRTSIIGPIIEKGRVTGIYVKRANRKEEVHARLVIEATGFSRVLRMKLPKSLPVYEDIDPTDVNIAYREIIEYDDYEIEEPNVIRIYLDQKIAPGGYWWYFPESRHVVNVGLGVQGGKGYPSPRSMYEKLKKHPLLKHKYGVLNAAGAPLPTRRPSNTMVGPGIVVIGDAGYTVNPLHGGGMGYGFRAAYFTATVFEEAYNNDKLDEEGLWPINTLYMKAIGAKQAALDIFRMFLQRLDNDDIRYGMEKRLIPESDVYYTSSEGDITVSTLEKLGIILRGLRRPSLLAKLKVVADYMKKVKEHYMNYPQKPSDLEAWTRELKNMYEHYRAQLG